MEGQSYRATKLLEHAMKVVERIFKHRIRQQIDIDDKPVGDLVRAPHCQTLERRHFEIKA